MNPRIISIYSQTIQSFLKDGKRSKLILPIQLCNIKYCYEKKTGNYVHECEKYIREITSKIPSFIINSSYLNNARFFGIVDLQKTNNILFQINDLVVRKNIAQGLFLPEFQTVEDFEKYINQSGYQVLYISFSETDLPISQNHLKIILKVQLY